MSSNEAIAMPVTECRGVRVCDINCSGELISPVRGTRWTSPLMRADEWADTLEALHSPGIHFIRDPGRPVAPSLVDLAVVYVSVPPGERVVTGLQARRASAAMVDKIVLHPRCEHEEAVRSVWAKHCPVVVARKNCVATLSSICVLTVDHRKRGLLHGVCQAVTPEGLTETSRWRNGKLHGKCVTVFSDGSWLVEQYRNGKRHGVHRRYLPRGKSWARYCASSGTVIVSRFADGKLIEEKEIICGQE